LAALLQAISKPRFIEKCHSERSEESRLFNKLRPFASLRVTEKTSFEIASNIQGRD
jgi:hypothetical protein